MKRLLILTALMLLITLQTEGGVIIDSINHTSATSLPRYSKFEVKIKLNQNFDPSQFFNVFDSTDIDMYAIFTSPTGKKYRRNAFWMIEYERCDTCENLITLEPGQPGYCSPGWIDTSEYLSTGDPRAYLREKNMDFRWRIRFAPNEIGTWSYKVYVHTPVPQHDSTASYNFTVISSSDKGYIYKDTNHRYFRYKESGDVFIPIGLNSVKFRVERLDSLYNRVPMSYATELITKIAPHGGNLLRIMMSPENFEIEWGIGANADGPGNYTYRQRQAADLDSILALAEQTNVYLQLVFDTQDELGKNGWWINHPYNGIITDRDDFFSNLTCRAYYKQKMRYVAARWGYSPHIFAYEPMQEIDGYDLQEPNDTIVNFWSNNGQVVSWYRDIVRYGKFLDTNHMYVASTRVANAGYTPSANGLFDIPELDIINNHFYGSNYNGNFQLNYIEQWARKNYPKKAHFFGELGVSWGAIGWLGSASFMEGTPSNDYNDSDPVYVNMSEWHNTLWGVMMSGASGPALHWDNDIAGIVRDKTPTSNCWGGRYRYLEPLRRFVEDEPIFLQHPEPIANVCSGRGWKDQMWHPSYINAFDTANNPCNCYPREYIHGGISLMDSTYVVTGISTTRDTSIAVFGLKTSNRVIGWIHNKKNYWYNLPHSGGNGSNNLAGIAELAYLMDNNRDPANVPILDNDSVTIYSLATGVYKIDFYSTIPLYETDPGIAGKESGGIIPAFTDTVFANCEGSLSFRIPMLRTLLDSASAPFAPDYGFKLTWISPVTNTDINTNTTWNVSSDVPADVTISNGATLTISGTGTVINMPKHSRITVEPGSKLVIDGARITTMCDSLWEGIMAKGQPGQPQLTTHQGTVELKNGAVVENARRAFRNYIKNDYNTGGGILLARNSTFRNNRKSLEFITYQNTNYLGDKIGDKSRIVLCSFEVDSNYRGNAINYPFDCHASLWEVDGVRFEGCSFTNNGTGISAETGSGIYSYRAGYQVVPYCPSPYGNYPCSDMTRSYFKGFRTGIHASDALTSDMLAVSVDGADFVDNSIGVYAAGSVNVSVTLSDFQLGNGKPIGSNCYDNIGIYTAGLRELSIKENSFGADPDQLALTVGVYTSNSVLGDGSEQGNIIYKNSFSHLSKACWAANRNVTYTPYDNSQVPATPAGLYYQCNTFDSNQKAIFVTASLSANATGQSILGGKGNVFNHNIIDIENQADPFSYEHNGGSSMPSFTGLVTLHNTGETVSCGSGPSAYGAIIADPELVDQMITELPGLRLRLSNGLAWLNSVIDDGDREGLFDAFMSSSNRIQFLEDYAPYLSARFLRMVAEEQVLSEVELVNALSQNPSALGTPGFIDRLITNGYVDESERLNLEELIGESNALSDSLRSVASLQMELSATYRKLVTHIKNDSLHQYQDSIISWLTQTDGLAAAYDLVGAWFSHREYDVALGILLEIPITNIMTATDSMEYQAFKAIFDVQYALDTSGRHHTALTDPERTTLIGITQTHPTSWITDIAHTNTQPTTAAAPCYWVYESLRKTQEPNSEKGQAQVRVTTEGNITVYPNPARDQVTFRYGQMAEAKDPKLTITSSTGVRLLQADLPKDQQELTWNTHSIQPGYYIWQILDGKRKIATGRVVIVK